MCGIFGVMVNENTGLSPQALQKTITLLFRLSESRGKEAAGLAIRTDQAIHVYKEPLPASKMIAQPRYQEFFQGCLRQPGQGEGQPLSFPAVIMGHSRLVTNGLQGIGSNNQPVVKSGMVGIHNGIIVNDAQLWAGHPSLHRQFEVDTEVILALIRHFQQEGRDLAGAVAAAFQELEGSASIAVLLEDGEQMALATNTGSLYLGSDQAGRFRTYNPRLALKREDQEMLLGCPLVPVKKMMPSFIARLGLRLACTTALGSRLSRQAIDLMRAKKGTPLNQSSANLSAGSSPWNLTRRVTHSPEGVQVVDELSLSQPLPAGDIHVLCSEDHLPPCPAR